MAWCSGCGVVNISIEDICAGCGLCFDCCTCQSTAELDVAEQDGLELEDLEERLFGGED
jgi:hypothetical protein